MVFFFFSAAFVSLCCIFGAVYVTVVGEKCGRRWTFIICSVPLLINWIVLYYARTFPVFMLSRFLGGLSSGSIWVLSAICAAEYTPQKSRGLFLSMILMVTPAFGIGLGHILGVLFHWRTLVLIGIALSSVSVLLPYFWVESPHWLALKGRFEECEEAFRKLHGHKADANHELQLLIKTESSKQKAAMETNTNHSNFRKFFMAMKKGYFWQLMLMTAFLYTYYAAAGKVIFNTLANVILKEMTGSSDVLLYMLLVDGSIFLGTCISCILIKKLSIRVLLFSSGLIANGVLIALSAGLYFSNGEVYIQWVNVTLLALYFIIIHVGPYPVLDIILGELFPLDLKLYCFLLASPLLVGTVFLCIIIMPYVVSAVGYHGLFLLNSAIMFICLGFFYVRLPETKGKTLQEIELYFKTKSFNVEEVLDSNKQTKALIA